MYGKCNFFARQRSVENETERNSTVLVHTLFREWRVHINNILGFPIWCIDIVQIYIYYFSKHFKNIFFLSALQGTKKT